eukprot:TRINITY_DN31436_c0_g1_i1.p1 TRINITY_DN31436_c0_g1~~TRINITY_DN31436_c0_g1_i1.p1  ORF type:complete len:347 (-),score=112.67 TRINITY_DN31436_c0_g1_i1:84-1124(-)
MAAVPATQEKWVLAKRPETAFQIDNFQLLEDKVDSEIQDGELFVKILLISIDPALRFMLKEHPPLGLPVVPVGGVIPGLTISQVIASKVSGFSAGDFIVGRAGWQQYGKIVSSRDPHLSKIDPSIYPKYPLYASVSNFGINGLTPYFAYTVADPKPGEALLVSGAAGASGLAAALIGKIHGLRVFGIAGTDEKCKKLVQEHGFEAAINYKTQDLDSEIKRLLPNGVDIFFDTVGGPTLDVVLNNLAYGARILMMGNISQYNNTEAYGIKNLFNVTYKNAQIQSATYARFKDLIPEGIKQISEWIDAGKLPLLPVTLTKGLESVPKVLVGLFNGTNEGKTVVEVAQP